MEKRGYHDGDNDNIISVRLWRQFGSGLHLPNKVLKDYLLPSFDASFETVHLLGMWRMLEPSGS